MLLVCLVGPLVGGLFAYAVLTAFGLTTGTNQFSGFLSQVLIFCLAGYWSGFVPALLSGAIVLVRQTYWRALSTLEVVLLGAVTSLAWGILTALSMGWPILLLVTTAGAASSLIIWLSLPRLRVAVPLT